ncbi:hypothetical protein [Adhaeribacter radiodurans]|uniref:Uncharacterized protein n=1 Tax=Adhaeribacter radiodurans TaxID=2745197 RepID=A0A7L7L7D2_9BACT|nr:hypothetical protein [Adhaeribacter radiodurans]QMU28736.1 hypothetical protein HUW48_12135 [Adhaeribacter radiodurans]
MIKISQNSLQLLLAVWYFIGSFLFSSYSFAQKQIKADSVTIMRQETQRQFNLDPQQPLTDRVRVTSPETLQMFREAGMSPREHELTTDERSQLKQVLAALPPLHQKVLKEHLRSINFLDNMPNTALTTTLNSSSFPVFDITVRAAIFHQTASEWMTEKERTCFKAEGSSLEVSCDIGSLSALLYVLLHETTHMVDGTLHLAQTSGFSKGIWSDRTRITAEYSPALFDSTRYRGGKPLPIRQAPSLYQSLSTTPFVSLYSTSSWNEDLAEYLSVYHFTQKLKQPFRIILRDNGKEVLVYEPLKSKLVRSRLKEMKQFYQVPAQQG